MKGGRTVVMVALFCLLGTSAVMGASTKIEPLFTCRDRGVDAEGALNFFAPLDQVRAAFKKRQGRDCSGATNTVFTKRLPLIVKTRVPVSLSGVTEPAVWTKFHIWVTYDLCGGQTASDFRYQLQGEYDGLVITGRFRVLLKSITTLLFSADGNLAGPASFSYKLQFFHGSGRREEVTGTLRNLDCVLAND